jgi:hypothetical protein
MLITQGHQSPALGNMINLLSDMVAMQLRGTPGLKGRFCQALLPAGMMIGML